METEFLTRCAGVEGMSRSSNDVAHGISNPVDLLERLVGGAKQRECQSNIAADEDVWRMCESCCARWQGQGTNRDLAVEADEVVERAAVRMDGRWRGRG